MFLVALDLWIIHLATNQTCSVKDNISRTRVEGVLGGGGTKEIKEWSKTLLGGQLTKVTPRWRKLFTRFTEPHQQTANITSKSARSNCHSPVPMAVPNLDIPVCGADRDGAQEDESQSSEGGEKH